MSNAPRYRLVGYDIGTAPDENGGWVHWTDHEAEIAKLTADLAESRAYPLSQFFAGRDAKKSKKPERIWARPDYNECWHKRLEEEDVEYVRADLYAAKSAEIARLTAERDAALAGASFQARVQPWMMACFGPEVSADRLERGDRLLEEVFELLQSGGYPKERTASLAAYVWSRDAGDPAQEVGGVMVTLAAYCLAHDLDMHGAGETELARVWTKVEAIRAKQAGKPKGSALPQAWPAAIQPDPDARQADLAKAWTMATAAMAERAKSELSAAWAADLIVQWAQSLTPPADLAAKIGGE